MFTHFVICTLAVTAIPNRKSDRNSHRHGQKFGHLIGYCRIPAEAGQAYRTLLRMLLRLRAVQESFQELSGGSCSLAHVAFSKAGCHSLSPEEKRLRVGIHLGQPVASLPVSGPPRCFAKRIRSRKSVMHIVSCSNKVSTIACIIFPCESDDDIADEIHH